MSDFLIYAARLQDAGITRLLVTITTAKDRTRMMNVSPLVPIGDEKKYPVRTFELGGTDRVLDRLKDDMAYSEEGPTAEKVQQAINAHPAIADDLREWFADWLASPMPTDAEIAAAEVPEGEMSEFVKRTSQYAKGLYRGFDAARSNSVRRAQDDESFDGMDQDAP